ncbi:MAG: hypothetical protein JSV34_01190 [Candidatus Omnitrophota bacterium]|nr:MAG: hypothetical protein JSV34_01190 [Candidatus Omnitrophota bacterium]
MSGDYFDYQSVSEQDENLDFKNLKPCPHCKKPVPADATLCLYCGESVSGSHKKTWIIWVAVFVIITFVALILLY